MLPLKVFKEGTGRIGNRRKEDWRRREISWEEADWLYIGFKYSHFEVEHRASKEALLIEGETDCRSKIES